MQLNLFHHTFQQSKFTNERQLLYDLFQAYYDTRRNKRNKKSSLAFEQNYESNLFELFEEVRNRAYKIKPSVCFINFHPVQREIFAADFRDRIVHRLVFNCISPIFERIFINDSYSCRKGRGTSYGIKRIDHFIRSCSSNYHDDCYILKLDIKGYFMSINKDLLFSKTKSVLEKFRHREVSSPESEGFAYSEALAHKDSGAFAFKTAKKWNEIIDFELVYYLLKKIIYNNPVENYIRKGSIRDWQGLPPSKSLFCSKEGCGLPIGNLTSQLFSNIYLNDFDQWITHKLKCRYYGRYVDDFVIIHKDKEYLKKLIPQIKEYLKSELKLELHPKKIYLQHYSKGMQFLGAYIKPFRIYIKNSSKGRFYKTLKSWNEFFESKNENEIGKQELHQFASAVNSYLGMMRQYKTYKLRKLMVFNYFPKKMWNYFSVWNLNKIKLR